MTKQQTLAAPFELGGKGLHTGLNILIKFLPADDDYGIRISRVDLPGQPTIRALAENITKTERGTVLSNKDMVVSTIEHAMAALYGMGVDNCHIEVDAPEFPILDGSAKAYVEKIREVGIVSQSHPRDEYIVTKRIEVSDPVTGAKITVLPDDKFSANVLISFDSPILSNQYATLDDTDDFASEISSARTFVFVREIEKLLEQDLIKGGDLDNAIVIYDRKIPQEQLRTLADSLGVSPVPNVEELGYLNHRPLAYPNEPARHKLLDLIGDLALIGCRLRGHVIATCPGHSINSKLTKMIRKDIVLNQERAPIYDPNATPVLDVTQIKKLLPHRFPMLFVDKVIELGPGSIVGVKNYSIGEPYFQGHFPDEPVVPGVFLIEAAAQIAGIMVISQNKESEKTYSTYLMKVENARFRHKVCPGDSVIFKIRLTSPIRRNTASIRGVGFVGNKLVFETDLLAQIVVSD